VVERPDLDQVVDCRVRDQVVEWRVRDQVVERVLDHVVEGLEGLAGTRTPVPPRRPGNSLGVAEMSNV
jgi:hypothetical protein